VYATGFQVETEFSQKQFMLCFLYGMLGSSAFFFRNLVMLKRKSMVLLTVYAVRKRTITGAYQKRFGANDWSHHDGYFESQSVFGWIVLPSYTVIF